MLRTRSFATMAIGVVVLTANLQAQGSGPSAAPDHIVADMMSGPLLNLLKHKPVQSEINLTADQKKRLSSLNKEIQEAWDPEKISKLSPDEQLARLKEIGDKMDEEKAKNQKKVERILSPQQLERVKQIHLQVKLQTPGFALVDPQLSKELGLTNDQKTKIKAMNAEAMNAMGGFRPGRVDPASEDIKKMVKAHKEREIKIIDTLTADQKERLEKLQGTKFDISTLRDKSGRIRL